MAKKIIVTLSNAEHEVLSKYAKTNSLSMDKAIKNAFFEKLEDEYDIGLFDQAYSEYLKDPKTYSLKEVVDNLKA